MRILLINQFFWPDSSATSQLLSDLARYLASEGHDIEVVCADGRYAVTDFAEAPAVKVNRVKALPFGRGRIGRILSYSSFYFSAAARCFTVKKPDLALILTTPPLLSLIGILLKYLRGTCYFIWEMDVYPDVAVSLGYLKSGGVADRFTGLLADYSRHHSDGIIALGNCMKDRLVSRGVDRSKIFVSDNWADGSAITPHARVDRSEQLVILYSGNLGLAHDLDTISSAIFNLREDKRFRFEFVGGGVLRKQLETFCSTHQLDSVSLRSYAQRANLGESLGVGDIGLVTQKDSCCGAVVPSKIYGLLAAGLPVLFIGPKQATPAHIIERYGCGWQVDCGDVSGLTRLLGRLVVDRHEIEIAASRARRTLLENFDLPIGVARIARILGLSQIQSSEPFLEMPPAKSTQCVVRSQ